MTRKAFVARVAVCSAASAACVALEGTVRAPGTDSSPFVLIPYAVSVIALLVFLWASVGLCFSPDPIREYKYERYVLPMKRRAVVFAIAEGLCAAGETVYLITGEKTDGVLYAALFYALCALGAFAAVFAGKTVASSKWKRIEKKSRLEE
jgi:hypothetical protein